MRRKQQRRLILLVLGLALLAVGLAACGGEDSAEPAAPPAEETAPPPAPAEEPPAPAAAEPITMVFASGGSRADGSWTQSWFEGTEQGSAEFGDAVDVTFVDETNTVEDYERAGAAALSEGTDIFVYATAEVPQLVDQFAAQFPDRFVCGVGAPLETYPDNVCTVLPRFEIGTFLAGVVAGSMVDHIGVIGAFDFPILTSELEGFVLGARYVNPEIEVSRVFVNTFVDPAEGRAAAEAQIAAGARIIFTGLSDAIQGVYLAAREQGETYVVAQYFDSFEQAPDVVLTSVIYNLQGVAKKLIELAATGELANQHYSFGLADLDVGRLAPFHDLEAIVPQEAKDNLADATALIESGDLVVPNPGVLGTSGSGSDVDPQSLVQG